MSPRIDTGLKLGTERGIATTEIWIPVAQDRDRVLYGDIRLTGDDHDNFEGNLGGGYRHIYGDTVFGAHAWIDRRKTARGSTFNQATVGVEALGKNVDARLNAYVPLSGSKTYTTPNTGRDEPYLAGSGVFYDTAGTLVEEPQGGFDIELGYRLPILEDRIDSVRVYAGGYHFGGDETPDITGWRTRVSADVTSWLQVGARFQKDAERGSQGFLEATLRFPGKASFRREGLRARLDESPERDIDIVTGAAVTDTGIAKPVLNESGDPQRVLHVDNTNGNGGNGTKDNPYSTLKAAEAAMKPYDVIYVHEGDGTTTGQSLGIVIDKPNVKLIGSGVDLVVEGGRVTGATAGTTAGSVLAAATANPVITNTEATIGNTTGNGVFVSADKSLVTGIAVQNASRAGIFVYIPNGSTYERAEIQNVMSTGNTQYGVFITAQGPSSAIQNINIAGLQASSNLLDGLNITSNTGRMDHVSVEDVTAISNTREGVRVVVNGGTISHMNATGLQTQSNRSNILVEVGTGGYLGYISVSDSSALNAVSFDGLLFRANGVGTLAYGLASNITATGNTRQGARIEAINGGTLTAILLENSLLSGNLQQGLAITSGSGGNGILSASIESTTATANGSNGVLIDDDTAGAFVADLGGGALGSTGGNRIFGNTGTDIRVDLDGGQLKAENNWWGVGTGLAGGETTLDAASTIDATPFLAADPGP